MVHKQTFSSLLATLEKIKHCGEKIIEFEVEMGNNYRLVQGKEDAVRPRAGENFSLPKREYVWRVVINIRCQKSIDEQRMWSFGVCRVCCFQRKRPGSR
jgi:hypothetical protein